MGFLNSINHKMIIEACNRALAFKTFKSYGSGFGVTTHEYQAKLRSATVTLSIASIAGTKSYNNPKITITCKNSQSNEVIAEFNDLTNPIDAYDYANLCWQKIIITDRARLGNLDEFECFNYLDFLFYCAYTIRNSELQVGKVCKYEKLDEIISNLQQNNNVNFDREASKFDICKLIVEEKILSRFTSAKDAQEITIDDRVYLDARVLIESNFDGTAMYKLRRY